MHMPRSHTTPAKKSAAKNQTAQAPAKKRGRPRKDDLAAVSHQILEESNRLIEQQNELNRQLGETLTQIQENQDQD